MMQGLAFMELGSDYLTRYSINHMISLQTYIALNKPPDQGESLARHCWGLASCFQPIIVLTPVNQSRIYFRGGLRIPAALHKHCFNSRINSFQKILIDCILISGDFKGSVYRRVPHLTYLFA